MEDSDSGESSFSPPIPSGMRRMRSDIMEKNDEVNNNLILGRNFTSTAISSGTAMSSGTATSSGNSRNSSRGNSQKSSHRDENGHSLEKLFEIRLRELEKKEEEKLAALRAEMAMERRAALAALIGEGGCGRVGDRVGDNVAKKEKSVSQIGGNGEKENDLHTRTDRKKGVEREKRDNKLRRNVGGVGSQLDWKESSSSSSSRPSSSTATILNVAELEQRVTTGGKRQRYGAKNSLPRSNHNNTNANHDRVDRDMIGGYSLLSEELLFSDGGEDDGGSPILKRMRKRKNMDNKETKGADMDHDVIDVKRYDKHDKTMMSNRDAIEGRAMRANREDEKTRSKMEKPPLVVRSRSHKEIGNMEKIYLEPISKMKFSLPISNNRKGEDSDAGDPHGLRVERKTGTKKKESREEQKEQREERTGVRKSKERKSKGVLSSCNGGIPVVSAESAVPVSGVRGSRRRDVSKKKRKMSQKSRLEETEERERGIEEEETRNTNTINTGKDRLLVDEPKNKQMMPNLDDQKRSTDKIEQESTERCDTKVEIERNSANDPDDNSKEDAVSHDISSLTLPYLGARRPPLSSISSRTEGQGGQGKKVGHHGPRPEASTKQENGPERKKVDDRKQTAVNNASSSSSSDVNRPVTGKRIFEIEEEETPTEEKGEYQTAGRDRKRPLLVPRDSRSRSRDRERETQKVEKQRVESRNRVESRKENEKRSSTTRISCGYDILSPSRQNHNQKRKDSGGRRKESNDQRVRQRQDSGNRRRQEIRTREREKADDDRPRETESRGLLEQNKDPSTTRPLLLEGKIEGNSRSTNLRDRDSANLRDRDYRHNDDVTNHDIPIPNSKLRNNNSRRETPPEARSTSTSYAYGYDVDPRGHATHRHTYDIDTRHIDPNFRGRNMQSAYYHNDDAIFNRSVTRPVTIRGKRICWRAVENCWEEAFHGYHTFSYDIDGHGYSGRSARDGHSGRPDRHGDYYVGDRRGDDRYGEWGRHHASNSNGDYMGSGSPLPDHYWHKKLGKDVYDTNSAVIKALEDEVADIESVMMRLVPYSVSLPSDSGAFPIGMEEYAYGTFPNPISRAEENRDRTRSQERRVRKNHDRHRKDKKQDAEANYADRFLSEGKKGNERSASTHVKGDTGTDIKGNDGSKPSVELEVLPPKMESSKIEVIDRSSGNMREGEESSGRMGKGGSSGSSGAPVEASVVDKIGKIVDKINRIQPLPLSSSSTKDDAPQLPFGSDSGTVPMEETGKLSVDKDKYENAATDSCQKDKDNDCHKDKDPLLVKVKDINKDKERVPTARRRVARGAAVARETNPKSREKRQEERRKKSQSLPEDKERRRGESIPEERTREASECIAAIRLETADPSKSAQDGEKQTEEMRTSSTLLANQKQNLKPEDTDKTEPPKPEDLLSQKSRLMNEIMISDEKKTPNLSTIEAANSSISRRDESIASNSTAPSSTSRQKRKKEAEGDKHKPDLSVDTLLVEGKKTENEKEDNSDNHRKRRREERPDFKNPDGPPSFWLGRSRFAEKSVTINSTTTNSEKNISGGANIVPSGIRKKTLYEVNLELEKERDRGEKATHSPLTGNMVVVPVIEKPDTTVVPVIEKPDTAVVPVIEKSDTTVVPKSILPANNNNMVPVPPVPESAPGSTIHKVDTNSESPSEAQNPEHPKEKQEKPEENKRNMAENEDMEKWITPIAPQHNGANGLSSESMSDDLKSQKVETHESLEKKDETHVSQQKADDKLDKKEETHESQQKADDKLDKKEEKPESKPECLLEEDKEIQTLSDKDKETGPVSVHPLPGISIGSVEISTKLDSPDREGGIDSGDMIEKAGADDRKEEEEPIVTDKVSEKKDIDIDDGSADSEIQETSIPIVKGENDQNNGAEKTPGTEAAILNTSDRLQSAILNTSYSEQRLQSSLRALGLTDGTSPHSDCDSNDTFILGGSSSGSSKCPETGNKSPRFDKLPEVLTKAKPEVATDVVLSTNTCAESATAASTDCTEKLSTVMTGACSISPLPGAPSSSNVVEKSNSKCDKEGGKFDQEKEDNASAIKTRTSEEPTRVVDASTVKSSIIEHVEISSDEIKPSDGKDKEKDRKEEEKKEDVSQKDIQKEDDKQQQQDTLHIQNINKENKHKATGNKAKATASNAVGDKQNGDEWADSVLADLADYLGNCFDSPPPSPDVTTTTSDIGKKETPTLVTTEIATPPTTTPPTSKIGMEIEIPQIPMSLGLPLPLPGLSSESSGLCRTGITSSFHENHQNKTYPVMSSSQSHTNHCTTTTSSSITSSHDQAQLRELIVKSGSDKAGVKSEHKLQLGSDIWSSFHAVLSETPELAESLKEQIDYFLSDDTSSGNLENRELGYPETGQSGQSVLSFGNHGANWDSGNCNWNMNSGSMNMTSGTGNPHMNSMNSNWGNVDGSMTGNCDIFGNSSGLYPAPPSGGLRPGNGRCWNVNVNHTTGSGTTGNGDDNVMTNSVMTMGTGDDNQKSWDVVEAFVQKCLGEAGEEERVGEEDIQNGEENYQNGQLSNRDFQDPDILSMQESDQFNPFLQIDDVSASSASLRKTFGRDVIANLGRESHPEYQRQYSTHHSTHPQYSRLSSTSSTESAPVQHEGQEHDYMQNTQFRRQDDYMQNTTSANERQGRGLEGCSSITASSSSIVPSHHEDTTTAIKTAPPAPPAPLCPNANPKKTKGICGTMSKAASRVKPVVTQHDKSEKALINDETKGLINDNGNDSASKFSNHADSNCSSSTNLEGGRRPFRSPPPPLPSNHWKMDGTKSTNLPSNTTLGNIPMGSVASQQNTTTLLCGGGSQGYSYSSFPSTHDASNLSSFPPTVGGRDNKLSIVANDNNPMANNLQLITNYPNASISNQGLGTSTYPNHGLGKQGQQGQGGHSNSNSNYGVGVGQGNSRTIDNHGILTHRGNPNHGNQWAASKGNPTKGNNSNKDSNRGFTMGNPMVNSMNSSSQGITKGKCNVGDVIMPPGVSGSNSKGGKGSNGKFGSTYGNSTYGNGGTSKTNKGKGNLPTNNGSMDTQLIPTNSESAPHNRGLDSRRGYHSTQSNSSRKPSPSNISGRNNRHNRRENYSNSNNDSRVRKNSKNRPKNSNSSQNNRVRGRGGGGREREARFHGHGHNDPGSQGNNNHGSHNNHNGTNYGGTGTISTNNGCISEGPLHTSGQKDYSLFTSSSHNAQKSTFPSTITSTAPPDNPDDGPDGQPKWFQPQSSNNPFV